MPHRAPATLTRRGAIGRIGAAVGLAAAPAGLTGAARAQTARKTFVLVHGALVGGWCWRRVSRLLEKQGHKVFAPTLTGLGERSHLLSKDINLDTHVADIVNVIKWEGLADFCLVAHSYAGFPASGALEQIGGGASSIVWLDALKPENGETVIDGVPGPSRLVLLSLAARGAISFPPSGKPPVMLDARDAAFVAAKATPHPIGTYLQPVNISGARERVAKKTYIRLPRFPSPVFDKALAQCKADTSWSTFELPESGHMAMLDAPERLADLLLQAA
jgi:pimeloyl-ACP methyl ester carboxylesterase